MRVAKGQLRRHVMSINSFYIHYIQHFDKFFIDNSIHSPCTMLHPCIDYCLLTLSCNGALIVPVVFHHLTEVFKIAICIPPAHSGYWLNLYTIVRISQMKNGLRGYRLSSRHGHLLRTINRGILLFISIAITFGS